MEGSAVAVCEILKYLIIHWKCETAKGALLEGQLAISIEALNSKHQANTLHCVTTITSAGSICGGLVCKTFLKEMRSILPGLSAKLDWTSEEASYSQDESRVDEQPRTLVTDSLVIKNFLRKIVMVHPKIRFNFSVKMNGVLSTEIFGSENEPTLNLSNGIALVVNCQHYMSGPTLGSTQLLCSRIHPVLGHPVMLFIPGDVAGMDILGELTLTPAAAVCPCPKAFSNQLNRISSVSVFLYGPSGLPLILPSQEQSITTVCKDISYFMDWKKYHLCMVPNLDLSLDRDMVLPDMSYQVESSEGHQSQNMDPQGQTLLLILFVDFHSGFPVQQMQLWALPLPLGAHALLAAHLSAVLRKSRGLVQESIQLAVDQALEQHHQAAKAYQKLQTSLAVAVSSILSIVTGSTSRSFRKICLQALQLCGFRPALNFLSFSYKSGTITAPRRAAVRAADTQELGTKLHGSFHEITQHRAPHHCSCEVKQQLLPDKNDTEDRTEDAPENSGLELLVGTSGQAENKRLKKGSLRQVVEGTRAFHSAGGPSPSEVARRRAEPLAASPTPGGSRAGPGGGPEDALWLHEVANLSEWLSPGP
ncbi:type 2 DNA topoisomerase 6 subunit B-like isoform X3 [Desmodus rotundus]|uniref:type 2 DNA topoisomerase 6 subunit B-like isoform X3 n=2 Tax=Desmodus rotundus TaxID=9430 RepID=UPI0023818D23|nr:type 2 DNA topoisomerase 6 subunit B-like isoform X3 [Desmodus rotundus]